ncbi:MAG: alpha-glucan family phosphorylase [Hormoscilla sp. SP5CHS1]|nr:alpha-glucan family phosphorylase [Hormoscilla sp. SP5CHS1]
MQPIRTFKVSPALPERLKPLRELAYNLHWDWNVETKDLFRRLDPDLWESTHHNPVLMLGIISQARLNEAAEDEGFAAQMDRAARQLEDYLNGTSWYAKQKESRPEGECYAYFSAEFGLTYCLPIYSGGLGVLAGDHLKSASDLGIPLVGVGLLYQEGYFSQYLNADGWQQERYTINDFYNLPLHLERDTDGQLLRIQVDYPGRQVHAHIWRVQVGRVPLYMLDTNIEPNSDYDQSITSRLYGGDQDMRIHQEIMLGIGGLRALKALGLKPTTYHMNEGHSAFLSLERMRVTIQEEGLSFTEAREAARSSQMFTTHTPVSAGFDLFSGDKMMYYLGHYGDVFGLPRDRFLALGRANTGDLSSPFNMATFAIKMSSFVNGVSKLHGKVSQALFQSLWPGLPVDEVPVAPITNGVHARSCVAKPTQELYDRYLGPKWSEALASDRLWERVLKIPDGELWRNHEQRRSDLVLFVREHLQQALRERGASPGEIAAAGNVLDPGVLTIGFARRFATYKRATLFLRDMNRIKRILLDDGASTPSKYSVQFVIAGKAHPKDMPGKELIREIIQRIREEGLGDRVVFVPNYNIYMSQLLVAGCDIWLNNPRRPREASGTSGMKASMNGLMNLSILDGWWDEADYARTGWSIGAGEDYSDQNYQDDAEAGALYDVLDRDIVPLFYDRDAEGIPRGWVEKMKDAIRLNCPVFNTTRMVQDYARLGYFPASDRCFAMGADNYQPTKELAHWRAKLFEHWYDIKIEDLDLAEPAEMLVNQTLPVKARLHLGRLTPDDLLVQLYQGSIDENGQIVDGVPVEMELEGKTGDNQSIYTANITYTKSGLQGLSLRVLPKHKYLSSPYLPRLILWANS